MTAVICTLPNASDTINGVAFFPHARGMISEPIEMSVAVEFSGIPGYEIVELPVDPLESDDLVEDKKPVKVGKKT